MILSLHVHSLVTGAVIVMYNRETHAPYSSILNMPLPQNVEIEMRLVCPSGAAVPK